MQVFEDGNHDWLFWFEECIVTFVEVILFVFDVLIVEHKQLLSPGPISLTVVCIKDVVSTSEAMNFVFTFVTHFLIFFILYYKIL